MEHPVTSAQFNNTPYWLQFISDIIKSTIWPLLIFFIFVVLYKKRKYIIKHLPFLLDFLKRTKSVKIGQASIEFSEDLKKVDDPRQNEASNAEIYKESSTNAETTDPSNQEKVLKWFTPKNEFLELAKLRPDYAILDSWQSVERRITNNFKQNRINFTGKPAYINDFFKSHDLSPKDYNFFMQLRTLRNKVIHTSDIIVTYSDALVYREKCIEAIEILNSNKD
ncbi:hypothetical protein [Enterococcus casseliflavus]|nr:hypothetical protein [Enterococcus casseliflavus]MUN97969.1 hypothetical protein [Enterococcus casseliflavus]